MLIDTHCHLDAAEFDADRPEVAAHALRAGVTAIVIPAVERANFGVVRDLARRTAGGAYALGIHPLYVERAGEGDLQALREAVQQALDDPRFVAIGEIGLDFFVPEIAAGAPRERQEHLRGPAGAGRRIRPAGAAACAQVPGHPAQAPAPSWPHRRHRPCLQRQRAQQAQAFVDLGFALGMGGAMTYERALQIRRHATDVALEHLVLETDAPDIPPAWLHPPDRRNRPGELARIADTLATLRGLTPEQVARATSANALRVLPRLAGVVGLTPA